MFVFVQNKLPEIPDAIVEEKKLLKWYYDQKNNIFFFGFQNYVN